jgi:hypothetical protein
MLGGKATSLYVHTVIMNVNRIVDYSSSSCTPAATAAVASYPPGRYLVLVVCCRYVVD